MSGALSPHGRENSFGHRNRAEEIGFELEAQFLELDVFGKSGNGEPRVVDENIHAAVVAEHGVDDARNALKFRYVKFADVDCCGDSCCGYCLVKPGAAREIAHGGHHAKP